MSTGVELHLASVKRRQTERLTTPSTAILPSWSPDGRYILYDTMATGADQRNIVRWRLSTGETTTLGVVSTDSGSGHQTVAPTYPRAAAPTIDLPGDNGRLYSNGAAPKQITATAETEFDSIRAAGLVAGDETEATTACQSACPSTQPVSVTVPADEYEEGTYPVAGIAQSENGTPARAAGSLVIDRWKPLVLFDAVLSEDGDLTISPADTADPQLADGTAGSGIQTLEYQVKTGGTWTSWQTLSSDGTVSGGMSAATDVRVRAVDRAGNVAFATRPAESVEEFEVDNVPCGAVVELDQSPAKSYSKTWSPEVNVRVRGRYKARCTKPITKLKWSVTQFIYVAEVPSHLDPPSPRSDVDDEDGEMHLDCVPGRREYRYQVIGSFTGLLGTTRVRGRFASMVRYRMRCNESGMWRVRASSDDGRPNYVLGRNLGAPNSRPAGYEAHHMIPAIESRWGYDYAQDIGYRCRIRPNNAENGVWMWGPQHRKTHNKVNALWVYQQLYKATEAGYGCDFDEADRVMAYLEKRMRPGEGYPGRR